MSKRRPLIQGLNENAKITKAEEDFVFGETPQLKAEEGSMKSESKADVLPTMAGRVPITIRVRPEIGSGLKRVSLQRQLDSIHPNSMQDIVDEAIEQWLTQQGYLEG